MRKKCGSHTEDDSCPNNPKALVNNSVLCQILRSGFSVVFLMNQLNTISPTSIENGILKVKSQTVIS